MHRRLCVIRDLVRVLELVQISLDGQIVALVVCVAVEDGCKLFAGDGIVRAKLVFAVARENAVLRRPCDRVSVPLSGLHIGKAVFALRRGAALHAPENGRHHAAHHRPMRTEQGLARTEHQSVFVDEHHIAVEPVLFRNIGKGIHVCARIFVHAPACIHGHILRQINTGNLVRQAAFAVPADKGMSTPGRDVLCQVNVGIVRSLHAGNITAAACFKAQRVVGDGWIVAAATAAGVGPVGVDGGICMEYGIRRDLCSAALFGVPAVEAVTAASGGAGQRGQLPIGGGHAADRGRTAVAVKGDDELGGRRRCVLLEDGLDLHIGVRHDELIVLDGHAAAHDLPLLEVVADLGRSGQGDFRAGRSLCMRGGSRAVSVITDGDGVGGGGNNAVFPQRLDFGIHEHGVGISHLVLRAADFPSLELLIGGSSEAAGGQDVNCPCIDGHGIHAAAAVACVEGDRTIRKRRTLTHCDLRIGAGKVVVILRIADEIIAGRQVFNLDTGAGGVDSLALRTVFHRCIHAGDLAVAAALGSGRDTDQAVRRFLRGFADAPRCGHGPSAAVRPSAGLGCDANGVIACVCGGVACDVHCGGIITAHGCGMLGAIVGVGSGDADAGLAGIGGCRRRVLLEDSIDLHIAVRHEELIVLDGHACRRFDLPLLEVIAGVWRGSQGDFCAGRSLCRRCGSRSATLCGHGDGILGGCRRRALLEECLDLHIGVRHEKLIVLDGHAAADDLPLLEVVALFGHGGQGNLRTSHGQ